MAMHQDDLKALINEAFPEADFRLQDLRGDEDHYLLEIASEKFQGKSRVAQHKMVYDALGHRMGGELHALSIKKSLTLATKE